ncbi:hypothetical protein [Alteromonas sp. H39]|uniref:hypothetical protein n=1 Tax=Alteromonas sp. H39 TaxID=3389876 RepID=UPI0039E1A649
MNSIIETFEFTPTLTLVCALASAAIANADNRSPLGFFILGCIAPPLALLILAATRKDENNRTVFVNIINGRNAERPTKNDWMGLAFSLSMGVLVFGAIFYFS